MLNWDEIDTIFLDMDGTLLDLHFDDYFWREYVPEKYSEKFGLDPATARDKLLAKYHSKRGTLDWYSIDFWTRELELDIELLKYEIDHLIQIHPFVPDFLDRVRSLGKRTILVTNAHGKSLSLKMKRTQLGNKLDSLICAHDIGLPKEDPNFWKQLQFTEPFERTKTLLIDDNKEVLESARSYGIKEILAIAQPNSKRPPLRVDGFRTIDSFKEILPTELVTNNPI
jgi:putative hydrolase of the HAD superfamily